MLRSRSVSQFSCSVMSDSETPWTAVHQASLSITNSQSLLKLMPIKLMPSNHLILCCPLLLLLSVFPSIHFPMSQFFATGGQSIRVSASASVLPMNSGLISFRMEWLCQASVFSLVLSCHNKDLERQTLKPSARHSSQVLDKPCYSS